MVCGVLLLGGGCKCSDFCWFVGGGWVKNNCTPKVLCLTFGVLCGLCVGGGEVGCVSFFLFVA